MLLVSCWASRLTWNAARCCRCCTCCLSPTCRSRGPCRLSPRRTPGSGWRKPAKQDAHMKHTMAVGAGGGELMYCMQHHRHTVNNLLWKCHYSSFPIECEKVRAVQWLIVWFLMSWPLWVVTEKPWYMPATYLHTCAVMSDLWYWSGLRCVTVPLITGVSKVNKMLISHQHLRSHSPWGSNTWCY